MNEFEKLVSDLKDRYPSAEISRESGKFIFILYKNADIAIAWNEKIGFDVSCTYSWPVDRRDECFKCKDDCLERLISIFG